MTRMFFRLGWALKAVITSTTLREFYDMRDILKDCFTNARRVIMAISTHGQVFNQYQDSGLCLGLFRLRRISLL